MPIINAEHPNNPSSGINPADRPLAICIPTICCGDLLLESVAILLPQMTPRDRLFVMDNGRQNLRDRLPRDPVRLTESARNLGVAGSWNRLLRQAFRPASRRPAYGWALVLNDDIALAPNQLGRIKEELIAASAKGRWMVVGPYYWSVFAINQACLANVGYFDEEFYPAYFEDNDYHYRLRLVDASRYEAVGESFEPAVKRNSVSLQRDRALGGRFETNRARYVQKWGGLPGQERHVTPYGKKM